MTTAEGFAPAKLNLTLHVTGQRADGYHLLDSLVVFADIGDRLTYQPGPELALTVGGPFAEGVPTDQRNLVWRAAEACGWTGHIHLDKSLPHGAGIGGGSSDAAAVLRDLGGPREAALPLGADVPVCLSPYPQRMMGIGEHLSAVSRFPAWDMVLINPGVQVPTPQVFQALDTKHNPAVSEIPVTGTRADMVAWLSRQRNDLQAAALCCAPQIQPVLDTLRGAELARMSGSGATCFGIYPDAAEARRAAQHISQAHPEWWVQPCRTRGRTSD